MKKGRISNSNPKAAEFEQLRIPQNDSQTANSSKKSLLLCKCGHPKNSHKWAFTNAHGTVYKYRKCRKCKQCEEFQPASDSPQNKSEVIRNTTRCFPIASENDSVKTADTHSHQPKLLEGDLESPNGSKSNIHEHSHDGSSSSAKPDKTLEPSPVPKGYVGIADVQRIIQERIALLKLKYSRKSNESHKKNTLYAVMQELNTFEQQLLALQFRSPSQETKSADRMPSTEGTDNPALKKTGLSPGVSKSPVPKIATKSYYCDDCRFPFPESELQELETESQTYLTLCSDCYHYRKRFKRSRAK